MTKKCVAFLDILGFKGLVTTLSLHDLAARYERLTSTARALALPQLPDSDVPRLFPYNKDRPSICSQYIFSDSIILVANADTDVGCLQLLVYVWRLEQLFIAAGMPLRGAVDYGDIYSNTNSGIVLGKALSAAHSTEGEQDWIGICINNSVIERYDDIFKAVEEQRSLLSDLFKMYPVPLKKSAVRELYTVNWRFNYIVEHGTRSLFSSNPNASIQQKVANTLAYARAIVESGRPYARNDKAVPLELRAFYVGKQQPPFPHGDDL